MKKLIKRLVYWISRIVNDLSPEVDKSIRIAVFTVEALKKAVDSRFVTYLTFIIPGDRDDRIIAKAREILPFILLKLNLAQEGFKTADEVLRNGIENLKNIPADIKPLILHNLAVQLAKELAEIEYSEAIYLSEYYYRTHVKKSN